MRRWCGWLGFSLVLLVGVPVAQQTSPCAPPPLTPAAGDANIFSPEQAEMLGDLLAEMTAREYQFVGDAALDAPLQRMASRLAEIAGVGKVQVRIIELPTVNAFAMPGGRILVARKLIAFARSEDELAGVIAHEMGHVAARDGERTVSAEFRRVLNVTSVTDREDIRTKLNRWADQAARKRGGTRRSQTERAQQAADQWALWLAARAGYSPQAFVDFWDRLTELDLATGNWLTDLFGATKPEAKRLRLALAAVGTLPASCAGTRQSSEAEFKVWQQQVAGASRAARAEALHGVLTETTLQPLLRTDISHLRFSPDGRWVLAQDDASLFVFAREKLTFKFRVDAPDALPAQFTPDSSGVVFFDENYRVERWNLAAGTRVWVRELVVRDRCLDQALSPDGAFFACASADFELEIQDTETGKVVVQAPIRYRPILAELYDLLAATVTFRSGDPYFQLRFSPDVRYAVVARGDWALIVDMTTRKTRLAGGGLTDRLGYSFSFLGPDKIVGVHIVDPRQSAIVSFPRGEVIQKLTLGWHRVECAAHGGDFVMLRGNLKTPVAVFDTRANQIVSGNATAAFDAYDDLFLSERRTGELGLYKAGPGDPIAQAVMPDGPLGRLRAAAVSPDFGSLALSLRTRGGVWDLRTGRRQMLLRGFRGVHEESSQNLYLDFPRTGQAPRTLVRVDPTTGTNSAVVAIHTSEPKKDDQARSASGGPAIYGTDVQQYGPYLVGWTLRTKDSDPRILAVHDATTGKELWTRAFPKGAPAFRSIKWERQRASFVWMYDSEGAKAVVEAHSALKGRFDAMGLRKEDVAIVQFVDLQTGAVRGHLLVDLGRFSFVFLDIDVVGDVAVVGATGNRTLTYSLASGQQTGNAFGAPLCVSRNGSRVAVQNERGHLTIHALPGMERVDEFSFPALVSLARFTDDGRTLFVLTAAQRAYTLAIGGAAGASR